MTHLEHINSPYAFSQPFEEKYQTPTPVANLMASMIPDWVKSVLEPTPGSGNLVAALESAGKQVYTYPSYEQIPPLSRFDAVVMNPPFFKGVEYKMLDDAMVRAEVIVALMPWYTIINSERRTKKIQEFGLVGITHLPRRIFQGIRVQTCIIQMKRFYRKEPYLKFYDGPGK